MAVALSFRARCVAVDSARSYSPLHEMENCGPMHLRRITGRVAQFLYGSKLDKATGFIGTKMLNGALWLRERALNDVCPVDITDEVGLTQFLIKEVRSGVNDRLMRCIEVELLSVVYDVLFSKGRLRKDVFAKVRDRVPVPFFSKIAEKGHATFLKHVLSQKVLMDSIEEDQITDAFIKAMRNGHLECMKIFLSRNGFISSLSNTQLGYAFVEASRNGHEKCLSEILTNERMRRRIPHKSFGTALFKAIQSQHTESTKILFYYRELISRIPLKTISKLFALSVEKGHTQCLKVILSHKKFSTYTRSPNLSFALSQVAEKGHFDCLNVLINEEGLLDRISSLQIGAVLHTAVAHSRLKCIQVLFAHKSYTRRVPNQDMVAALEPVCTSGSLAALNVVKYAQFLWSKQKTKPPFSLHKLLHEFNLVFSTDMYRDVINAYENDSQIPMQKNKQQLKESITHVLVGYAREDGDSLRKQKAIRFLHSIWEQHGSPETDEGLDFGPNHMWDSLPFFTGAFIDCLTG